MSKYYCEVQEFTTDDPGLCDKNRDEGKKKCLDCHFVLVKLPSKPGKKKVKQKKTRPAADGAPAKKKDNLKMVTGKEKKERNPSNEGGKEEVCPGCGEDMEANLSYTCDNCKDVFCHSCTLLGADGGQLCPDCMANGGYKRKEEVRDKCPGCGTDTHSNAPFRICEICKDLFCTDCLEYLSGYSKEPLLLCPTCLDECKKAESETKSMEIKIVSNMVPPSAMVDIGPVTGINEEAVREIVRDELNDNRGVITKSLLIEGTEAFIIHRLLKAPDVPDLQGQEARMFAQAVGNLIMEAFAAERVIVHFDLEES